jgi:hypothetical protein
MTKEERIEKLLYELKYEITTGMLQNEIGETMSFEFIVPVSKEQPEGVVLCRFIAYPIHRQQYFGRGLEEPRLRVVKGGKP